MTSERRSTMGLLNGTWPFYRSDQLKRIEREVTCWDEAVWSDCEEQEFCKRRLRIPDVNPGSLLSLAIGRESEAGNNFLSKRRVRGWCRVERLLY